MYELKETERIFIFTGPVGAGRSTIANMVGNTLGMKKVISNTTRDPRPSEEHGQDYYFVNRDQFIQAIEGNEFLEHIDINNNLYGIKNKDVEHLFEQFSCIYIILNPSGADILKKYYGDKVVRLFIYADRTIVEERQRKKGLTEPEIMNHLKHYEQDMAYMKQCEYSFENLDLAHNVFDITNILDTYLDRGLVDKD
ncbi:MAG: guanylate kinase [Paenibacillaceae bacterium]